MKTFFLPFFTLILFISCSENKASNTPVLTPVLADAEIHLDSLLSAYSYYNRFSGTVLVVQENEIVYHNSFGWADVENQIPNHNASVYGIGSFSKNQTAVAILKLVQDGKIKLTDKLYDFFPELGETAKDITLHHMLSMSSGIYEDFSRSKSYNIDEIVFPEADPITTHDLVHYFGEISADFKPGKKFDYSNINYIILAAIVEQVSGLEYGDFLKEHFFKHLVMQESAFGIHNVPLEILSKPYTGMPSEYETPEFWHDSWVKGAGGNFASAHDIYQWMYAVNNRKVLDENHTQKLFDEHNRKGREHYGYGWQVGKRKGNTYIYHEGGTLGYVCEAGFFPEHDLYVVVLTNHTHGLWDIGKSVLLNHEINREIHNILFNQPYNKLPVPQSVGEFSFYDSFNVGGFNYHQNNTDNRITLVAFPENPSFLDLAYGQNLTEDSRRFKKAVRLAEAFGNENFRYVLRQGQLPMRVLLSTQKLEQLWDELNGDTGEFLSYNFYRIPCERFPNRYWMRLVHENKEIGLLVILSKRGKIKGMHVDQRFSFNGPSEIEGTIINDSLVFIDGFKYGFADAQLVKINNAWQLEILGRSFNIEPMLHVK